MNIIFFRRKRTLLLGFAVGFCSFFLLDWILRTLKSIDSASGREVNPFNSAGNLQGYEKWRLQQGIRVSKLDFDSFVYKENATDQVLLEANWLKGKVPITCVVFVDTLKAAVVIKETWGENCNKVLFFSSHLTDANLPLINLSIKLSSSWQYLCEVMRYLWARRAEFSLQWIIFVKDDLIMIPENLRHMLSSLDSKQSFYFGHTVVLWGQSYNLAQAGYVLSYDAVRKLMMNFDTSEKCMRGGKYWKKEDYDLGKNLAKLGIYPVDTRDPFGFQRFNGLSLVALLWGIAKSNSHWTRALYPPKFMCCSNRMVTFSINEPSKFRTIHNVLYNIHIFNQGTFGNTIVTNSQTDDLEQHFQCKPRLNNQGLI